MSTRSSLTVKRKSSIFAVVKTSYDIYIDILINREKEEAENAFLHNRVNLAFKQTRWDEEIYIPSRYEFEYLFHTNNMKTKRQAFAIHCGLDFAETEDYRYHYGHTSQPVWAINDLYYCVTKANEKPDIRLGLDWVQVKDDALDQHGYKVWESTN